MQLLRLLSLLILAALLPFVLRAQSAPYTIHSNSRLVVLDVVVTDKQGSIAAGLNQADFQVFEAGVPQKILSFEPANAHVVPPDANIESSADLARLAPLAPVNVIVVDEFNTLFENMAYARFALKAYLATQPARLATPTTLVAVDMRRNLVLQDYTQDKAKLVAALDHHFSAYPWQAHQSAWRAERYIRTLEALQKIASDAMAHSGHKNVIWIGGGFPRLTRMASSDSQALDQAVSNCINVLRDARITLYAVDSAGVEAQTGNADIAPGSLGLAPLDPFQSSLDFGRIAVATGGKALFGRNDVDAEISRGIREGSSLYTLSYRPSGDQPPPRQFRRIEVKVLLPGLEASSRQGYYVDDPVQKMVATMIAAEYSDTAFAAVPIQVSRTPGKPDFYRLQLHVGPDNYLSDFQGEPPHADLSILAAAFDPDGYELKRVVKTFRLTGTPPPGGLVVDVPVEHKARSANIRFIVMVQQSGKIGSADLALRSAAVIP